MIGIDRQITGAAEEEEEEDEDDDDDEEDDEEEAEDDDDEEDDEDDDEVGVGNRSEEDVIDVRDDGNVQPSSTSEIPPSPVKPP